jgi:hypothetical protein
MMGVLCTVCGTLVILDSNDAVPLFSAGSTKSTFETRNFLAISQSRGKKN